MTVYQIASPFDGTIIKKDAVASQKADLNDVLFTLADLNTVWVTANVAESDVASVPKIRGGAIRLSATAYGSRVFPAQLLSVGAMVDPQTRTVPLLAQTDNHDGLLKPGMFVRILLDSPTTERALTVPHAGVVEIEGKNGSSFPPRPGGTTAEPPRVHVLAQSRSAARPATAWSSSPGLKEGDVVVASGAFLLKSELILQNQTEEE